MTTQQPPGTCGRALTTGQPCPDHPTAANTQARHDAQVLHRAAEMVRFDAALREAEGETELATYGRELADMIETAQEPTS